MLERAPKVRLTLALAAAASLALTTAPAHALATAHAAAAHALATAHAAAAHAPAVNPAHGSTVAGSPASDSIYVALGDSYSSGVGAPPYFGGACDLSVQSYPWLYANNQRITSFDFAACSGATTAIVRATQLGGLGPDTELVTITVGGDDLGFSAGLLACYQGTDDQCQDVVRAALAIVVGTLPTSLAETYAAIQADAPGAQFVVMGYPRLFEETDACPDLKKMNKAKRVMINQVAMALNAQIKTVVQSINVKPSPAFVPVDPSFNGHRVCSADPWINDLTVPGPFHPNATGYLNGYLAPLKQALAG